MLDERLTGGSALRPFVPAKDFALSGRFYEALGFIVSPLGEKIARVELASEPGAPTFLLQDFYAQELAENLMLQLLVQNLDVWWQHLAGLDLDDRFGVPRPQAPETQPWGLRVAYLWDPAGVLWHLAETPKAG